jgi:hypothetical protein
MSTRTVVQVRRFLAIACCLAAATVALVLVLLNRRLDAAASLETAGRTRVAAEDTTDATADGPAGSSGLLALATRTAHETGLEVVRLAGTSNESSTLIEAAGDAEDVALWLHLMDQDPGSTVTEVALHPSSTGISARVTVSRCELPDGCNSSPARARTTVDQAPSPELPVWADSTRWLAPPQPDAGTPSADFERLESAADSWVTPGSDERQAEDPRAAASWQSSPTLAGAIRLAGRSAYVYWVGGSTAVRAPGETLGPWRIEGDGSLHEVQE